MRNLPLLLLLLLAPACAIARSTENEPLEPARLQSLVPGTTTAREVVERLGAPVDVVQLGKRSAYRYEFSSTKRSVLFLLVLGFVNEDQRADRAWLFFDENEVLTHMGASFDGENTRYAMPWQELHE